MCNIYIYQEYQEDVHEDMLCALLLPSNTTGTQLFKSLNDYISGKLNWSFCVGICTDGAAAMTGRISGLIAQVKKVAPVSFTGKCWLAEKLNSVLNDAIKVINYIKANSLNSCLFEQFCEEMDASLTHRSKMAI